MKGEPPFKLYVFITVIIFIVLTFIAIIVKNYVTEKYLSKSEERPDVPQNSEPEEVQQAKSILYLAGLLFLVLIVIFIVYKISAKKS